MNCLNQLVAMQKLTKLSNDARLQFLYAKVKRECFEHTVNYKTLQLSPNYGHFYSFEDHSCIQGCMSTCTYIGTSCKKWYAF